MADDIYHVTFTKNLPDIQKRGLDPLSQSLWAKQETGERYQQEPSVYGFTNPEDALSWAGRMSWDFRDEAGKHSDYSIIRLKGGEHWEDDPSEDHRLTGARPSAPEDRGRSVRYQGHIKPEDIVSITQFPEGAGVNEEFKAQFPEGMYEEWIKYYGDQLRGLPLDEPRSTDLVPVATPPEEEHKPGLPRFTGIGQVFRGLGSMIGGKKMQAVRKLIAMAQQGYELLPEDRKLLGDVLDMEALTKQIPGTGKGVDYFRQLLGMGPEEGGIISLQDLREPAPVYQSGVARAVDALPMNKGPGEQMLAMVFKSSGVKPEEVQWMGLADFLQNKESVTKQEIQDFVGANKLQIEEVDTADGDGPNREWERLYTLPGGENYREVAFTLESPAPIGHNLPPDMVADLGYDQPFTGSHLEIPDTLFHVRLKDRTGPNGEKILHVEELQSDWHQKGRQYGYQGHPNALDPEDLETYSRLKEFEESGPRLHHYRADRAAYKRLLGTYEDSDDFLINAQHQKVVPDAPLKKNWYEMAFRRVARMAAEEGYDSVAWTPGEVQAERYGLSNDVSKIEVTPNPDGTFKIWPYDLSGELVYIPTTPGTEVMHFEADKLDFVLGAELANKVRQQEGMHVYKGDDLKLGGKKLRSFYDGMIKNYASKFGKKFGSKVGTTEISTYDDWGVSGEHIMERLGIPESDWDEHWRNLTQDQRDELQEQYRRRFEGTKVWNLPITPKMKEELLTRGIETFAHGGFIDKPLYERTL